jgi:hypothetical protein
MFDNDNEYPIQKPIRRRKVKQINKDTFIKVPRPKKKFNRHNKYPIYVENLLEDEGFDFDNENQ